MEDSSSRREVHPVATASGEASGGALPDRSTATGRPLSPWFTAAVAVLLVTVTLYGLLADGAYRLPDGLRAQGRGQDLLTLSAVPVILWCALRSRAGSLRAHLVWLGLMLYLAYTYASYAFAVPYNDVFLAYVAVLGLASFGLLNGLLRIDLAVAATAFGAVPRRTAAWTLAVAAGAFAVLWLADIVPAVPGGVPKGSFVDGVPNPIYVLDLAWIIPLAFGTAGLLWRSRPAGTVLAAVLLAKLLTLGLAMLSMVGFMFAADTVIGRESIPVIALAVLLVGFAAGLLVAWLRGMRPVTTPWLRPALWP